jgi:hypothetical protein
MVKLLKGSILFLLLLVLKQVSAATYKIPRMSPGNFWYSVENFFSAEISIGALNNTPLWSVLITFLILFIILKIGFSRVHLFQYNERVQYVLAILISLISVFGTPVTVAITIFGFTGAIILGLIFLVLSLFLKIIGFGTRVSYRSLKVLGGVAGRTLGGFYSWTRGLKSLGGEISHLNPRDEDYRTRAERVGSEISRYEQGLGLWRRRLNRLAGAVSQKGKEKINKGFRKAYALLERSKNALMGGDKKGAARNLKKASRTLDRLNSKVYRSLKNVKEKGRLEKVEEEVSEEVEEISEREKGAGSGDWRRIGEYEYKKDETGRWRERKSGKTNIPGGWISRKKAIELGLESGGAQEEREIPAMSLPDTISYAMQKGDLDAGKIREYEELIAEQKAAVLERDNARAVEIEKEGRKMLEEFRKELEKKGYNIKD